MKKIGIIFVLLNAAFAHVFAQDMRIFADYTFETIKEISLSDHGIFRPHQLDTDKNGRIVLFDYNKVKLVVFDLEGDTFQFYGKRGKGPKEFGGIFDLKVDRNGEVFLVDTGNNKIVKWHVQAEYIGEMSIGSRFIRPARLTLCNNFDVMYILSSQYSKDGILHQFDKTGNLKQSFHKIEDQQERWVYYTDGSLACDKEGNLYYAKLYINEIIKYDKNGDLSYIIPVYDSEPNEEVIKVSGNYINLSPSASRYSGDIHYLNGKLYVSYSGLPKNFIFRYVDVYAESNQEYQHSIQFPHEFREFVITEDRIVTLREDENEEMYLTIFNYEYK